MTFFDRPYVVKCKQMGSLMQNIKNAKFGFEPSGFKCVVVVRVWEAA